MVSCIISTYITARSAARFTMHRQLPIISSRTVSTSMATSSFRHDVMPFDKARDAPTDSCKVARQLLEAIPDLKLYTRSSPGYEFLRGVYNKLITAKPLVICRPTSISQTQAIVKTASGLNVPVGVRCGGHDVFGRGCIADSVTIDMRELDSLELSDDKTTVVAGGGITSKNLVGFLGSHDLCTSNGLAGEAGWTSWASWGGYGPLGDYVGLGVDNIIGGKIITANGDLVEAEGELLWALRGAGGNFGIIAETTVQVYPMSKIQAGFIVYEWSETSSVLQRLQTLLDAGVPDKLCVQAGFSKGEWGLGMALTYIWPDAETIATEGSEWLQKLKGLGSVVVDTIEESKSAATALGVEPRELTANLCVATFRDFQKTVSSEISEPVNVTSRHTSITKFSDKTLAVLIDACEAMPDQASCTISASILHGKAARPNPASSFGTRQPHIMFHINAITEDAAAEQIGVAWVDHLVDALGSTDESVGPTYVSFMESARDAETCYGSNWDRLRAVKKSVDPRDVFRHCHGRLPVE
ncbi:hypothetical protein FZEAL_9672 [Fusarium zealandicum]|uniref:FAD-binding PCMH-type domain-containing protein n=1 Tax=Fusarium zealandicum TaxID=1053134 RepID=A0A8H4XFD2_9HYPO|nr:hypothetical protein FZEAL_9672 [Fusarium zealandicum]